MLTARQVQTIQKPGRHHDGHGLYLQVRPGGAKSWLYIFMRDRKQRYMGLGPADVVTLGEAREAAHECRRLLQQGIDPIEAKRARRKPTTAPTFRQLTDEFITMQSAGWRNAKTPAQFRSSLMRNAYKVIGDLPIDTITVDDVVKILTPIWAAKPVMADHVRNNIGMVLDAAKARGLRSGDNPAAWRGALQHLLPRPEKVRRPKHHAALPYTGIPKFMAELRKREGLAARALEFTILTAARTSETIGARWEEIDPNAKIWTVPGERMKSGRAHRVPVPDRALDILKVLPREDDNPHVFVGARRGRGLSNMAMLKLLWSMRPGITTHGFRSSFRDWVSEKTTAPREIAEAALAHVVGDRTEVAYARSDFFLKRRQLMKKWEAFCG